MCSKMKLIFQNIPSVLLMSLIILANAQRSANNLRDVDFQELARQNKITKQILEAYIQKKLGLSNHNIRAPSLQEILPMKMQREKEKSDDEQPIDDTSNDDLGIIEEQQENQEYAEDDSLQSVESEQIDSVYSEGMYNLNV